MSKPQSIRCQHKSHLEHVSTGGGIVMVLEGDSIFVQCLAGGGYACKRWTKLTFDFPGIDIDFTKAALTQETMHSGFKIGNCTVAPKRAPVVIKETK